MKSFKVTFIVVINSFTCDGGGGGGRDLHGEDLQVVPLPYHGGEAGTLGGHAGHVGAHIGSGNGGHRVGPQSEAGGGGGAGDDRGVADGAVVAGTPDADVVILGAQVGH